MDQNPDHLTQNQLGDSSNHLMDVALAQARILANFSPCPGETIPFYEALGRVLAEMIFARIDLPSFPNSAMDGFALRLSDIACVDRDHPAFLKVIGDVPAGSFPPFSIGEGEAARIMTGAPVPHGADCVVPVEETDFNYRGEDIPLPEMVKVFTSNPGSNIRSIGQDVRKGDLILKQGQRLRSQEIGFLSMLGIRSVNVYRKPKIGILSTGDELVSLDMPLAPGKIYDSNSVMLSSLARELGAEPFDLGIAPDQEHAVKASLDRAMSNQVDIIISTAGVSVGAFDYVRKIVAQNGQIDFWRVNMRPGKPFAFGNYKGIPFFGLPGNPVSAYMGFLVFVRPVINRMIGLEDPKIASMLVQLAEPIDADGRESYLRANVFYENGWKARLTGHQGSGNLRSLVQANALLIIPSGVKSLPIGSEVTAWLLS